MSDRVRVELRGVVRSDLDVLFEYSSDPESNQLAKVHPRGRAAFDAHWDKILTSTTTIARTIVVVGDRGEASVDDVDDEGNPLWRMAPSPHGPYWEKGQKVGYQDVGSWTFLKSTPEARL